MTAAEPAKEPEPEGEKDWREESEAIIERTVPSVDAVSGEEKELLEASAKLDEESLMRASRGHTSCRRRQRRMGSRDSCHMKRPALACADLLAPECAHAEARAEGATEEERCCPPEGGWLVMDRAGLVMSEEESVTTSSIETKVDQLLTWMLSPAVNGIPKLRVPSATDRADELLAMHGRDVEAAAREVVAGSERTVSRLVLNFCLERIPILGCPTVLLRTTWGNLRSVFIVAALYGHDLDSARVQHEALFCLVPPGRDADIGRSSWRGDGRGSEQQAQLLRDTTQKVARMMIRGALRRASGMQAVVDCFELAHLLYSSCGQDDVDDDGFVHVSATPASAARDLFRRKSLAWSALLWCSLPLLALGALAPSLFSLARQVPAALATARATVLGVKALPYSFLLESLPAILIASTAVAVLARGLAFSGRPRPLRRSVWRRLFGRFVSSRAEPSCHRGRWATHVQWLREAWPQSLTALVFGLHALLPAVSTYSAVSIVLGTADRLDEEDPNGWDLLHQSASVSVGVYILCQVVQRHIESEWLVEAWLLADGATAFALRWTLRTINGIETLSLAASILSAWGYAVLLVEVGVSRLVRGSSDALTDPTSSVFGLMAPMAWAFGALPGTHPLQSAKAVTISLQLVSIASQRRLVELLSRREVLLRLIGAERLTAQTLLLLLKGVGVAMDGPWGGSNPIGDFVKKVSPPPLCCAIVVALRTQAVVLGAMLVLAPWLTLNGVLGSVPSFVFGILAGAYACQAVLRVWYAHSADLSSPALRLALLVPGGVSGRAKHFLKETIDGAKKRAVQLMAMTLIRRIIGWWLRPITR